MSTNIPHITRKITGTQETKFIQMVLYVRNIFFRKSFWLTHIKQACESVVKEGYEN
jgi:hypothetical protein